eukprot:CAMPEP_0179148256 /NCGR_PEP_ID=MMETSP0796-20121207/71730_1 /TAXON_ID=73915 /ORGANISM="Pyrodinium bahamense, Strain pbaha01" /LENGTH=68 /DNA_ID=CAMNT_0020848949 /DNA_START=97 /DNA_END=299 /DNA_ORIENTATION=-
MPDAQHSSKQQNWDGKPEWSPDWGRKLHSKMRYGKVSVLTEKVIHAYPMKHWPFAHPSSREDHAELSS